MDTVSVTVEFSATEDPALLQDLGDLKPEQAAQRLRDWARLGRLVMSLAKVTPGREALSDYLGDFTQIAETLTERIEEHHQLFDSKARSTDGSLGEAFVANQLTDAFKNEGDRFEVWSATGHQGDIIGRMARPDSAPHKILIEVKDYSKRVPTSEVDKFRSDMRSNPDITAGVFVSLNTPVTGYNHPLAVDIEDGRPVFYVAQDNPSQLLFVAVWAMLRELLERGASPSAAGVAELTIRSAARIRAEVDAFLDAINDDVSRIDAIVSHGDKIRSSANALLDDANRLKFEISLRAKMLGRFLHAETQALKDGSAASPMAPPWSEAAWKEAFIERSFDWPAHQANLTTLLRWLGGREGVGGTWDEKGLTIQIDGEDRLRVTGLSSGLRLLIPDEVREREGIEADWEKNKPGQLFFKKGNNSTLTPEPIMAALRPAGNLPATAEASS